MSFPDCKNKLAKWMEYMVYGVFVLLYCYICLANVNAGHPIESYWVVITTVVVVILVLKRVSIFELLEKISLSAKWVTVLLVLGLVFRLLPLLLEFEWIMADNQGDCAIHYYSAQQLVDQGALRGINAQFESIHIHLFYYTTVLSWFYRLFGNISFAFILSNVLFDVLSLCFLSLILKKLKKSHNLGVILWWLNPVFAIMCWFPMANVLVNTILAVSIYCGICVLEYMKRKEPRAVIFAMAFGLTLFVGNLFRPLFNVVLIAEGIVLFMEFLKGRATFTRMAGICLVILLFALVPGKVRAEHVTELYGYPVPEHRMGWAFCVGSNYASHGKWSPEDNYYFWIDLIPNVYPEVAEEIMMERGIERYRQMSFLQFGDHMTNKLDVLFADVGNSIYDLQWTYANGGMMLEFFSGAAALYYLSLLLGLLIMMLKNRCKPLHSSAALFIILCFLGMAMAYLIIEVMNRYITMPLVFLTILFCICFPYDKRKQTCISGEKCNG